MFSVETVSVFISLPNFNVWNLISPFNGIDFFTNPEMKNEQKYVWLA